MNLIRVEEEKTSLLPALIERAGERASSRFLEFFTVNIRNPHTRAAYARAAGEFLSWCEGKGIVELGRVTLLHVAGYMTTSPMAGRIEVAQRMAGHANAKMTGLYDRRSDDISISEVERAGV